jgi:hypothetical protein
MIWREKKNQTSDENIENKVLINDILTTSMNSNNLSNIGKITDDCIDSENKREPSFEIFSLDISKSRNDYNEQQEN